jgi:hypothetical protein
VRLNLSIKAVLIVPVLFFNMLEMQLLNLSPEQFKQREMR